MKILLADVSLLDRYFAQLLSGLLVLLKWGKLPYIL